MKYKTCEVCGVLFHKRLGKSRETNYRFTKRRFCSIPCRLEWQRRWYKSDNPGKYFDKNGSKNPMFGKFKNDLDGRKRKDGYMRICINGQRILKHRFLMMEYLGRKLEKWEIVHHIDGDNTNNSLENLQIMSQGQHRQLHFEQGDLR